MHPTFEQLEIELTASLADLTTVQTQATPPATPEKWSIQQIVAHLLLSYKRTLEAFSTRLERGTPTGAKASLAQRLGQFYILSMGRFPRGRSAPDAVYPALPSILQSGEELSCRVHTDLVELDEVAERAQSVFGDQRAVSHLVLGPMSVESWRRFHLIHGRNHIGQILAIRAGHGF